MKIFLLAYVWLIKLTFCQSLLSHFELTLLQSNPECYYLIKNKSILVNLFVSVLLHFQIQTLFPGKEVQIWSHNNERRHYWHTYTCILINQKSCVTVLWRFSYAPPDVSLKGSECHLFWSNIFHVVVVWEKTDFFLIQANIFILVLWLQADESFTNTFKVGGNSIIAAKEAYCLFKAGVLQFNFTVLNQPVFCHDYFCTKFLPTDWLSVFVLSV